MQSKSEKCESSESNSFDVVWLIGFIIICYLLFKILRSLWRGLYSCVLADLFGATVNWGKLGKWAGKIFNFPFNYSRFYIVFFINPNKDIYEVIKGNWLNITVSN